MNKYQGDVKKVGNEIKAMREFIKEFSPIYNDTILARVQYGELVAIIKEIVREL